ncbi:MAG: hypothetical protein H5U19_13800 [Rhodobacteraceae bacterium]|jgi:hypothetical protein|nr:hypothetical protein [Paracoccaceae bacterium]
MEMLIWIGAALALVGVGMLIWCIRLAVQARGAAMDDGARRARLQRIVVINMAALAVSAIGLMMVVAGIALG